MSFISFEIDSRSVPTCPICQMSEYKEEYKEFIAHEDTHPFHAKCVIELVKHAAKENNEVKCPICREKIETICSYPIEMVKKLFLELEKWEKGPGLKNVFTLNKYSKRSFKNYFQL